MVISVAGLERNVVDVVRLTPAVVVKIGEVSVPVPASSVSVPPPVAETVN